MTFQKATEETAESCPVCGREMLPTPKKTRQRQHRERRQKDDLAKLFSNMVNHVYGHHEVEASLIHRLMRLEKRVTQLERGASITKQSKT